MLKSDSWVEAQLTRSLKDQPSPNPTTLQTSTQAGSSSHLPVAITAYQSCRAGWQRSGSSPGDAPSQPPTPHQTHTLTLGEQSNIPLTQPAARLVLHIPCPPQNPSEPATPQMHTGLCFWKHTHRHTGMSGKGRSLCPPGLISSPPICWEKTHHVATCSPSIQKDLGGLVIIRKESEIG